MLSYITIAIAIPFFLPFFISNEKLFFNTHMFKDEVFGILAIHIEKT